MTSFRWTAILVLLTLVVFPAYSLSAQSEGPALTVQGSSEVRVASDLATVRLGVVAQAATAEAAQREVNDVANGILEAVRGAGIADRDVQTARLLLTPVFSRQRSAEDLPEIVAYRASNVVTVRVEALENLGQVIDAGLGAGANQLEGVSFGVKDDLPARESALEEAITEARTKAEAMASALGIRLEGVLSVDEGGVFVQAPQMEMARLTVLQDTGTTPVAPGEVTVSASVTIRYRIAGD